MTAAEVITQHTATQYVGDGVWWCNCGTVHNGDHVVEALRVGGYAVVAAGEIARLESQLSAAQAAQYTAQAQASHR